MKSIAIFLSLTMAAAMTIACGGDKKPAEDATSTAATEEAAPAASAEETNEAAPAASSDESTEEAAK